MAKKTASDLEGQIASLAEDLRSLTIRETRTDIADGIKAQFLGSRRVSRTTFRGASPDDCILEALADPTFQDTPLQALHERFSNDGVSDDFRAGIAFALRLVADQDYEY